MTDEERIAKLEKTVRGFKLTTNQPNSVQGGFSELKPKETLEERLSHLEQLHKDFRIIGGDNVTVAGSLATGYAICATCPQDEGVGSASTGGGPTVNGACCIDGVCHVTNQAACIHAGGEYQGDGTDCDPNPCAATGACCIDGSCSIFSEAECIAHSGIYQGDGVPCGGGLCGGGTCDDCGGTPGAGACCLDHTCFIFTALGCDTSGGTFLGIGSEDCGAVICTVGACCLTAAFCDPNVGECGDTTEAGCAELGGIYHGDGTVCGLDAGKVACGGGCCCNSTDCTVVPCIIYCDSLPGFTFVPAGQPGICDDSSCVACPGMIPDAGSPFADPFFN